MKGGWVVVCGTVALAAGLAIGWSHRDSRAAGELNNIHAAHQMEVAGLCAMSLKAMDEGHPDRAHRALRGRLDSAVDQLYRLPETAFEFPEQMALPNLLEGVRRAADYLEGEESRYSDWATELWQRLE